jgi:tetratricopeptide (TPR) repeat protein
MNHYDDDALMKYVEGISPTGDEIARHVEICQSCSSALAGHRELADILRTAKVWEESNMLRAVPEAPASAMAPRAAASLRELAAVGRRLDAEDDVASKLCDELLSTPQAWWRTKLLREGGQTIGVVRQLLTRARAMQDTAPLQALDVIKLSTDVADELPFTHYPSDLVYATRAHAARDHAYILFVLGRMPEALAATDRAEDLFRQTALPDYELARVDIMRAQIYGTIDRVPEGIVLARRAAATFRNFGDMRRFINAQVSVGAMLYFNKSFSEALDLWQRLVKEPQIEDVTRIMVTNNIAMCLREMGDYDRAVHHLAIVIAEYELLGLDLLRAKSRWSLAATLVSAGRSEEALPIFDQTWKEFEGHGMESDAALVALELAEALLVLGRSERVPQICRTILDRFTAAGMTSRAITALAFLREAVAIGHGQPSLVRHVREFLRELPASSSSAAQPVLARLDD